MEEFKLHASLSQHKSRILQSQRVIENAFGRCNSWYVAFSGGKDSTVTLDLVRRFNPDVPAVSSIQEWCLPETKIYLDQVDNLETVASGSDHNTGWSPNWEEAPGGIKWLGKKGSVIKNYGRAEAGVFLGTRADENVRRKKLLRARGALFFHEGNHVWQCSPVAGWSVLDVWAYIYSRNLDYNRAYDRMREIGLPLDQQRIGPLAVERVLGYGQLAVLKRGWPDLFNAYATKHPEARLYV